MFFIVFDSWGKLPSGVLDGQIYSLGNFDQCLAAQRPMNITPTSDRPTIQPHYCLAELYMINPLNELLESNISIKGMDEAIWSMLAQHPNDT